jgi:hypothetical protein
VGLVGEESQQLLPPLSPRRPSVRDTLTAWEHSDQRRVEELEEISALLPPKKRPRLRAENFELPRHFFHHYASTREALRTRLRWTALSRTSETTTEGQ